MLAEMSPKRKRREGLGPSFVDAFAGLALNGNSAPHSPPDHQRLHRRVATPGARRVDDSMTTSSRLMSSSASLALADAFLRQHERGTTALKNRERFFAVHLLSPASSTPSNADELGPPYVFDDLLSAVQFCKRFKEQGRFREFATRAEAEQFSVHGDLAVVTASAASTTTTPQTAHALAMPTTSPTINGVDNPRPGQVHMFQPSSPEASLASPSESSKQKQPHKSSGEKTAFRAPKAQDLVRLRKIIQDGDIEMLRNKIWENPRLLIGSGDNPTIVHEGARYNAFHCAVRSNQSEVLEELIRLLRTESLFQKMYPDDVPETTKQRMSFLLGLYLNIPDKTLRANNPLHFASSLGHVRCVEVLVRQPECDTRAVNGDGQTAWDLAGERAAPDDERELVTREIRDLLDSDKVIIPILRDCVHLADAEVGKPVAAHSATFDYRDPPSPVVVVTVAAATTAAAHSSTARSPGSAASRKLPAAFIGPLPAAEAGAVTAQLKRTRRDFVQVRRTDPDKGVENAARILAREHGLGWNEYWPFLGCWTDLASGGGLALFDSYLLKTVRRTRSSFGTRATKHNSGANNNNNNNNDNNKNDYSNVNNRNNNNNDNNKNDNDSSDSCTINGTLDQQNEHKNTVSQSITTLSNGSTRTIVFFMIIVGIRRLINDILDDVEPLAVPDSLVPALADASIDHVETARAVVCKLFISHYERAKVCMQLPMIAKQTGDQRLECIGGLVSTLLSTPGVANASAGEENPGNRLVCLCPRQTQPSTDTAEDMDLDPVTDDNSGVSASSSGEPATAEELARLGFINGPLPTRTDYQVWLAVTPVRHLPNETCFPCVHRWISAMGRFRDEQMRVWKSPQVARGLVAPHVQTPRPEKGPDHRNRVSPHTPSSSYPLAADGADASRVNLVSRFNMVD